MSARVATIERLHALATNSNVPLPLCSDCATVLADRLHADLADLEEELRCYQQFAPPPTASTDSGDNLAELLALEADLAAQLAAAETEEAALELTLADLAADAAALDAAECDFWHASHAFQASLQAYQAERDALNTKYDAASRHLDKLKRTNVYNDVARLGHDGTYPTINGLRLGRGVSGNGAPPVPWHEMNAAFGKCV
ncbi:hypothetical protein AMAG_15673 [Allomyces macrogynus ATCC 38327]|uniref:Uncharacterized protein n=1 Tax=Allomyces macrogynus (strain ATCC 38327) TaxID=578462 RepID=A0A0L0TA57_ALLM3|nr:hypothetical protein AMAG_15673 [Allomyces macrogynus ATCC 38327]|eukprot:KNE71439.1 hypothetical protein AMAG_15673 [Allomyces macrogynus ATCC 38327]